MASDGTFFQRIKRKIAEDVLPVFKLTTHNRLVSANAALDQKDREFSEASSLLGSAAAERDRLAGELQQMQAHAEDLRQQLSEQAQAAAQTQAAAQASAQAAAQAAAQAVSQREAFESALAQVKEERDWLREHIRTEPDPVAVTPMMVVAAALPDQPQVTAFLAGLHIENAEQEDEALYSALQTSFRGSEALIKQRQAPYLDHLPFANPHLPVVDVGCGRGEFLELLRERNIRAVGVDTSPKSIESLRARGMEGVQQDGVAYLRALAPDSIAAVTAFQVVEHLQHRYLRDLIQVAYVKIAPGGFLFLETINPYCLPIFQTFYLDPTHVNPIPPQLLVLLAQFYGFEGITLFYRDPIAETVDPARQPDTRGYYQTYAMMGIKP